MPKKILKLLIILLVFIVLGFLTYRSLSVITTREDAERQVIGNINDYELTIKDFMEDSGLRYRMVRPYLSKDPVKIKEEIIDKLMTKNVLLQEAQRLSLDKEKAFMREIEAYWQQALLKMLIKNKTEEISKLVTVGEREMKNEYQLMKRKLFGEIIIFFNESPAKKLSKSGDNFDGVKENILSSGETIICHGPSWWTLGDLHRSLEDILFSLSPGEISNPVKIDREWVVARLLKEEERPVAPFKDIVLNIKTDMYNRKIEKGLEEWIDGLKKEATVKINKDVLDSIEIDY